MPQVAISRIIVDCLANIRQIKHVSTLQLGRGSVRCIAGCGAQKKVCDFSGLHMLCSNSW